ncbi:retrovirus-related pol polyprotein from transposon TNT 1-94 [Tanacetum coccineum]
MHDKKPDLSFLDVFGSLCYSINDSEDLGKLHAKADIGIFVGYAPVKKAFRIYNRRTWKVMKTIYVTFDELIAMASEQFSSRPGLQFMTPATSSSGLVSNPITQQPCNPPTKNDWDRLFQPMFDEYFNPPPSVVSLVQVAATPRAMDIVDSPVSTSIDQDAPSTNLTSQGSSSNVRPSHTLFELLGKWTKNHPIGNMIEILLAQSPTKKQLQTDTMWCYFDAFLTSVEPKNYKEAMLEPSWIDAMQEEIHRIRKTGSMELVRCPDIVMCDKIEVDLQCQEKTECRAVLYLSKITINRANLKALILTRRQRVTKTKGYTTKGVMIHTNMLGIISA